MDKNKIDIKENYIYRLDNELLTILLRDRSLGKNIIWATDNYGSRGCGYQNYDYITVEAITGYHGNIIKPRTEKSKKEQTDRIRDKAEVFTPSWICNKQNNLVDNAWYGTDFVFNEETEKTWVATTEPIAFPTAPKKVVLFLTLQDLQGENIKDKHAQIFDRKIDLLLVDETHFGARAEKYGAVLRASQGEKLSKEEKYAVEDILESMKEFDVNVTVHLAGTPYRILMSDEFDREQDLIAFYQFTDIVREQEEWDRDNFAKDEQRETFEKFDDCWSEYMSLVEAAIFEYAFKHGMRIAIETLTRE